MPTPITPFLYGPGYTWLIISHFQWDLLQTIATAFLSSSLVGSFTHCKYSLTSGFQIILQTWYPLIYCLYALSSPNTNLWTHIGVDRTILDKFQVQSLSFLKSCLYDQNVRKNGREQKTALKSCESYSLRQFNAAFLKLVLFLRLKNTTLYRAARAKYPFFTIFHSFFYHRFLKQGKSIWEETNTQTKTDTLLRSQWCPL